MGTTRGKRKKTLTLPSTFEPKFWSQVDGRFGAKRVIRQRVSELIEDTGAESAQMRLLVERLVFLNIQLETAERIATETGEFDPGVYTQMCNAVSGICTKLGLKRHAKPTGDLKAHIARRARA